eukprot:Lankesteria_metandrocarpae@DN2389_c0_g1_i1.p1
MALHICRFFERRCASIEYTSVFGDNKYVAVLRANSSVEIYEKLGTSSTTPSSEILRQPWSCIATLPGATTDGLRSMVVVPRKRKCATGVLKGVSSTPSAAKRITNKLSDFTVITAGLAGIVYEWDMRRMQRTVIANSFGGSIFCVAASPSNDELVFGCEDGSVSLLQLNQSSADDTLPRKVFSKHRSRILSLCFTADGSAVFGGTSDGVILRWITSTGATDTKMRLHNFLGGPHKDRAAWQSGEQELDCAVWSLVSVPESRFIVSGDSLGFVRIWCTDTCTLYQSFKEHEADVTSLAVDPAAGFIFSTGVDARLNVFVDANFRMGSGTSFEERRWTPSGSRYPDKYDLKTLSCYGPGCVVTGGASGKLFCLTGLPSTAAPGSVVAVPRYPTCSDSWIHSAVDPTTGTPLILCQHVDRLELWSVIPFDRDSAGRIIKVSYDSSGKESASKTASSNATISKISSSTSTTSRLTERAWAFMGLPDVYAVKCVEVVLKDPQHISVSSMSCDGKYIVTSCSTGTRLFRFDLRELQVTQMHHTYLKAKSLSAVEFFTPTTFAACYRAPRPRRQWQRASTPRRNGDVSPLSCTGVEVENWDTDICVVAIDVAKGGIVGTYPGFQRAVIQMYFSTDKRWMATIDTAGNAVLVDMQMQIIVCALPDFDERVSPNNRICSVAFSPESDRIIIFSVTNRFYVFDIRSQQRVYSSFADSLTTQLSPEVTGGTSSITSAVWRSSQPVSASPTGGTYTGGTYTGTLRSRKRSSVWDEVSEQHTANSCGCKATVETIVCQTSNSVFSFEFAFAKARVLSGCSSTRGIDLLCTSSKLAPTAESIQRNVRFEKMREIHSLLGSLVVTTPQKPLPLSFVTTTTAKGNKRNGHCTSTATAANILSDHDSDDDTAAATTRQSTKKRKVQGKNKSTKSIPGAASCDSDDTFVIDTIIVGTGDHTVGTDTGSRNNVNAKGYGREDGGDNNMATALNNGCTGGIPVLSSTGSYLDAQSINRNLVSNVVTKFSKGSSIIASMTPSTDSEFWNKLSQRYIPSDARSCTGGTNNSVVLKDRKKQPITNNLTAELDVSSTPALVVFTVDELVHIGDVSAFDRKRYAS